MIFEIIIAVLQLFSAIGWGLAILALLKVDSLIRPQETLALSMATGIGLNGWLVFVLGYFNFINQFSCLILILFGLLSLILRFSEIKFSLSGNLTPLGLCLLSLILYVFFLDFLEGFAPPGDSDTLAYHFAIPKLIAHSGTLVFTPRVVDGAVPLLIQMTYVPSLVLGGELTLTLWVFLSGWCLPFVLFLVARRYLNLNQSLILVVILVTTPAIIGVSGTGQVETRIAILNFTACFALALALRLNSTGLIILAAILAGFSASSKYYGLFFVLSCGLAVLASSSWFQRGALFSFVAVIAGFQWYFWNWFHTGDPFFPVLYDWLGDEKYQYWSPEHHEEYKNLTKNEVSISTNLFWYIFYPLKATIDGLPQFDSDRIGLGLYPLLILPFAIGGCLRAGIKVVKHELFIFAFISIVFYTLWFFSGASMRMRHLLPVLPMVLLCFAVASKKFVGCNRLSLPLNTGLAIVIIFQVGVHSFFSIKFMEHLVARETRDSFLQRTVNWYEPVRWVNKNISPASLILSQTRWYSYLLKPAHYYGHPFYQAKVNLLPNTDNLNKFIYQIRKMGVTHVINWPDSGKLESGSTLNKYIYKLSQMGCAKPLKTFRLNYMPSRTFWITKDKKLHVTTISELDLSNCLSN